MIDFVFFCDLLLLISVVRVLYNGIVGDIGCFLYFVIISKILKIVSKFCEFDFDFFVMVC